MKIKYQFATETAKIEVDEEWGNLLIDLDRQEYNNHQKETRRHCSLDALNLDDSFLPSHIDIMEELIRITDARELYKAINQLEDYQQELIKALYFDGVSVSNYAAQQGISQPAVSQQKTTAIKKLKNLLT